MRLNSRVNFDVDPERKESLLLETESRDGRKTKKEDEKFSCTAAINHAKYRQTYILTTATATATTCIIQHTQQTLIQSRQTYARERRRRTRRTKKNTGYHTI